MHATPRTPGDRCDQLVHRLLLPVERADGEHQREHEQPDAVADDVVAQQGRGDDPGRELAAGHLDRHQQRAEGEHEKRQRQRDDGLVQRRCTGQLEPARVASAARRRARGIIGASTSSSAMAMSGTVHNADLR